MALLRSRLIINPFSADIVRAHTCGHFNSAQHGARPCAILARTLHLVFVLRAPARSVPYIRTYVRASARAQFLRLPAILAARPLTCPGPISHRIASPRALTDEINDKETTPLIIIHSLIKMSQQLETEQ